MGFFWKNSTEEKQKTITPLSRSVQCKVCSISETGPMRDNNEDSILVRYPDDGYETVVAMVADGMGGHNAGEVASSIACTTVKDFFTNHKTLTDAKRVIEQAITLANEKIHHLAATNSAYDGMGTTAVLLVITNGFASIGHVGDSRLYFARQGCMQQLTKDHTLVNQMLDNKAITQEQAHNHPMKNVITQALGTSRHVEPSLTIGLELIIGDRFLLCTDGVNDVLSNEELEQLMNIKQAPFALEALKALCTVRNTSDNFSAIIVDIVDDLKNANSITKEQNIIA